MTDRALPGPAEVQYREVTIDREAMATRAAGDDDIPVVLATEALVPRWFGREILSMDRGAVDLSRAADGLPLLDSHDPTRLIGSVVNIRVSPDRKLRGQLRQGNHPDAPWIFQDIRDGHRPNFSVGYQVHDLQLVEQRDDGDVFRADKWELFEASTLAIPADIEAGAYRAAHIDHNDRGRQMSSEEEQHKPGPQAVTVGDMRAQVVDITRLAVEHGMQDQLAGWLERGLGLDQVKGEILTRKRDTAQPVAMAPGYMDLSARDAQEYGAGYGRMLISVADRRGLTGIVGEVSDQIAKRLNRPTAGLYVPLDLSTRTSITGNVVGTSSLGGAGVQTTLLPLIEILRNKMLIRQLGATVLSGLTGNVSFPRHIVPNTLAWEGENPSTPHAHTAATFDNVTLSPKSAMASSAYSRQFLVQSSFDASAFLQNDLASVCAVGLDLAAIDGTGSNNQPTGIMRTSNVGTATFTGSNGGIPTWAELVAFETTVENANGDIGTMGWITTPGLKGKLKATLKNTVAGSAYIWSDANEINGYPAFATKQMPSNFTAGTSTTVAHGVLFGTWSECLIGEFGGAIELIVDPYTNASQAMVNVTALMMVDVGVRHPAAFVANKTALIA